MRISRGEESLFGMDYERMRDTSGNWDKKISHLEKQKQTKQLKKLELERDIAVIDKEIIELKSKL